ncbi:MAG: hypothetical protein OXR68_02130 [Alphaproteobacteria bacterium]|nr:hypothetical protein [Alphaproteobacteria bacterium]MDD9919409.1 hypothetical protein [Alphaproteobacteria bacterium]
MEAKILKNSITAADNGRVEYTVIANNQRYRGFIEEAFFQDVLGQTNAPVEQKLSLTTTNLRYLETLTNQQIQAGREEIVII